MCHVLIIEDEPLLAIHVQALLEEQGATSFAFAVSQDEAIEQAIGRRPAFITSDVTLLDGTGPGAIAAIESRLGAIPVVYITATPHDCGDHPARRVLNKPFDSVALATAFHEMVLPAG